MNMIQSFTFVPWGNSYYQINDCPTGTYSHANRMCWNSACNVTSPPSNCFQGKPICQFGEKDCYANRLEACALKHYSNNLTQSLLFINCYEGTHVPSNTTAISCATETNMDYTVLEKCVNGLEGKQLDSKNAKLTALIPGGHLLTPWPVLNGVTLDRSANLLKAICDAYTGKNLPSVCSK